MSTLPSGIPELTLGWQIIEWCNYYLRTPDGDRAGDPWEFTDAQARFVLSFYAVDEQGRWRFRRGALRWSKGRGKSPMLAALCLAELCGPVRFSHFDAETGDPVGVEQPAAWVQIAATAESQTVNTMAMVSAMCPKGSRIVGDYQLDPGKQVIYKAGGGRLEIITASPRAAEGNRPTFVVMDEVQEWYESNGGHRLAEVLRRNLGKMRGRSVEAGNAHIPGMDSLSEGTWEAFCEQREGRSYARDILYDATEAPADTDLADPVSLRAGLEVCYADAPWQDLDRIMAEIGDISTPPDQSRRYYLNQITAAEDAWLAPHEWDAIADTAAEDTEEKRPGGGKSVSGVGAEVALFFDGSKSDDATALIGCRMSDGHILPFGIWEPDPVNPDSVVPVDDVERVLASVFNRYRVVAFFADVQEWQGQVYSDWPAKYGDDLLIQAQPSGRQAADIAWDMRSRVKDFTLAAEEAHSDIVEKRFTHNGSGVLSRHVYNARNRPNNWGISVGKESRWSPRKIDACVAMIGARMVRRIVLGSEEWTKYERRKNRSGRGRAIVLS